MAGLWWWAKESKQEQRVPGVDVVGAVLSVIMFATLVFGLIEGRVYGWWDASTKNQFTLGEFAWPTEGLSIIPVSLAISAVGFTLFVIWERARAKANKAVLLDLDLFKVGSFRNGSIAALIISMGEFGILFAIPLWLQNVLLLSPIESGMVLLWLAGGAFLASGVTGGLSGKVSPKVLVQGGVALELVGAIGIALFANTEAGMWSIAPFLFLYGIGVGMATAQLTGVIMVDVPMDKIGQASGSQSTVRQVGSALGIAVLGTMLFTGVQSSLETRIGTQVTDEVQSAKIVELVVDSAGGVIPGLTDLLQSPATGAPLSPEVAKQITEDAGQAFTDGAKSSAWAAAAFLLLGLISTFNIGSAKAKTPAKSGAKE